MGVEIMTISLPDKTKKEKVDKSASNSSSKGRIKLAKYKEAEAG